MKKLIFDKGCIGKKGYTLPETAIDEYNIEGIGDNFLRENALGLPCLGEYDVLEHYRQLFNDEERNKLNDCIFGAKYLPSIIDDMSRLDGFTGAHPYQLGDASQGTLELMHTIGHMLNDIFGMDMFTTQLTAVIGGMFAAVNIIKAYHKHNSNEKKYIIVPDNADVALLNVIKSCGYEARKVKMCIEAVKCAVDTYAAGIIIKNPDDDGNFIADIAEIAQTVHSVDGIVCCDANSMHGLIGIVRPGDMGCDMTYFDVENVFAISNYAGETDAAALGVKEKLSCYMPVPVIEIDEEEQYYFCYDRPDSIGKLNDFYGDFIEIAKALSYILSVGFDGFEKISSACVLNANYMQKCLIDDTSVCFGKFNTDDVAFEPTEAVDKNKIDTAVNELLS